MIVAKGSLQAGNFREWEGVQCQTSDRIKIVNHDARQGRRAARFELRKGDVAAGANRSELAFLTQRRIAQPGETFFYALSIKFESIPKSSSFGWATFCQWHSQSNTGQGPPVGLYFLQGNVDDLRLQRREASGDRSWSALRPCTQKVWHDFVFEIRWARNNGYIRLWHKRASQSNYEQVVNQGNLHTVQMHNGKEQGTYWKIGEYRNAGTNENHVLFHSGMVMATTFKDAAEYAHGNAVEEPETPETPTETPPPTGPIPGDRRKRPARR